MSIFRKLNLKEQTEILVVNAPESFEPELAVLEDVTVIREAAACEKIAFALAFVQTQEDVDVVAAAITPKAAGDALVWFAYPKKSSKKYKSEINRDNGWQALGDAGYEPVRQVAIDADWSALRFRRVEFIKSLKRRNSMAISAEGKKRTEK